ncbi:EamA family transporter [Listeria sp. PSOL-1]|uniref:EamA family transporter n=1 Tax=Listeria sp. PSOL-1 TaxID=1844999 RepID=UPI001E46646F|nr:EamA family transporter [Listeria sp. PSOL-1]
MNQRLLIGIVLMVCSAFCTSCGQAFWKLAENGLASPELYIGFVFYGAGAILMIVAFHFGELSVLHPLLSIGYVFAIFIGAFVLGENLTTKQLIGNCLIIAGAICLGFSGRRKVGEEEV